MTAVTAANLLNAGYREFPASHADLYERLFQKRVTDSDGTLYFINFREWRRPGGKVAYDTEVSCETGSSGYVWIAIREDGICKTEMRARLLWNAAGGIYYERASDVEQPIKPWGDALVELVNCLLKDRP